MKNKDIACLAFLLSIFSLSLSGDWRKSYLPEIERTGFSTTFNEIQEVGPAGDSYVELKNPGKIVFRNSVKDQVHYVRITLKPGVETDISKNPVVEVSGARLGFKLIREPDVSVVTVAVADQDGYWQDTNIFFRADQQEYPETWMDFTLRIDPIAGVFDLFHEKRLWAVDIPLTKDSTESSLDLKSLRSSFVKRVEISGGNPLFSDRDKNGVPDDFEKKFINAPGNSGLTLKEAYIETNGRF